MANQGGVRISINFYDSSRKALICEIEIRRSRGNKSESSHNNMHIAKQRVDPAYIAEAIDNCLPNASH